MRIPYIQWLSYKYCGTLVTAAVLTSLYGLIYTDNRTSLVQNTDTEKQLETTPFDPLIIPG